MLSWSDTPCVDGGFFVLMGNDEYLLRQIDAGERDQARDYAAWLLGATGGYAIKIVNPGRHRGLEVGPAEPQRAGRALASARRHAARHSRDTHRRGQQLWPAASGAYPLQQPRHAGQRGHHPRQHAGAGRAAGALHPSAVPRLRRAAAGARRAVPIIEYVNGHPELSVDVGQVMFGPATTITADGPVEYLLHKSSGRKWVNIDIELETGCGIVPLLYKDKAAVSALQWAIGLELFLLSKRPLAGGALDRSPERRLVPLVPGAHPAADGSQRPATSSLKQVNPKLLAGSRSGRWARPASTR